MAEDAPRSRLEETLGRWGEIQSRTLDDYRRVVQRMGEDLQMGSVTPQSWAADVFELWSLALRGGGAALRAALGQEAPVAATPVESVVVVEVPRGVEGWQFSLEVDLGRLPSDGAAEIATSGLRPAGGGFSLLQPRNVGFDPLQLERGPLGVATLQVALFSLPQTLAPGCYCGAVEAHPLGGGDPVVLTDLHVRITERGRPPLQHRAASQRRDGSLP